MYGEKTYTCVGSQKLVFRRVGVVAMGNEHIVDRGIRTPRIRSAQAKV